VAVELLLFISICANVWLLTENVKLELELFGNASI